MIKEIHFFNMIEILLALTVIAIGMTSVLGLFPVGLNASRNAVAQNMSADVADQMITYMRVINELDDTGAKYTANFITGSTDYSDSKYTDEGKIETESKDFLTAYKAGDITTTSSDFPRVASKWTIFKNKEAGLENSMFFVVQGPNCTEDTGERPIDYSAMVLVWKSTVQIKRLIAGGDPAVSTDWQLWPDPATYDYSGKLNIELSWPLELPYAERKKRYYQVVITKP
jgi:type II secretory pathway pseudopilin PulG